MRIALLIILGLVAACAHPGAQTPAVQPTSSDCESKFTRDQFVGTWNEEDSPGVYTLNADGTMNHSVAGENLSGSWEFTKWGQTPGKPTPGDENACVLWLKIDFRSGPMDSLYAPLSVTGSTIKISYMDRGNTIVWNRANKA